MGIGDANADPDKNISEAVENLEVLKNDIMRGNNIGEVISTNEVEMVLQAWKTGERQDFTQHVYGFGFVPRNKSSVIRAIED